MKKFRIIALVLALMMCCSLALTSCDAILQHIPGFGLQQEDPKPDPKPDPDPTPDPDPKPEPEYKLTYTPGTTLRMACGYNSKQTGMRFHADIAKDGITLADGKTYHTDDFKPTWVALMDTLQINIDDQYQGNSASNEYKYWQEKLDQIDVLSGTASALSEAGEAGKIIDLAQYLDYMPNFKAYLEANPIVRLSITGNTKTGAIYFSPYFDGVDDIERMPLMRTDWVEKLLNGEGDFAAAASKNLAAAEYAPYMPTSGKVTVETVTADGTGTFNLTKDYDKAGNIVAIMNAELAKGAVTGVQAVNMLRDYIDAAYDGYYGTNRADLFIGQNAAWDADELVALLRCVVANPQTLNGTEEVQGLFSREDGNNQRRVDMFRFAGTLFGVRGLESRQDFLYVGADGKLHDARQEEDTYVALDRMNAMAAEGLISKSYIEDDSTVKTANMLSEDKGFMHYDYNQTQTIYNYTEGDTKNSKLSADEKYMAVLVPVARWYDGTNANGVYMRFTESWRSVKTDGWGLSKAGIGDNKDKLHAALAIIDYAYSAEGQILMSYGPDAFIKTNADGSYVTFNFNGKEMPVIADATYEELWAKAGGNYTNYARQYLGSTLSFVKSQAFEYQCTHAVGREGAGKLSTAIALGVIKHPLLAVAENPWYTSVPTVLPTSKQENDIIKTYTELGSSGLFSTSKDESGKPAQVNIFTDIICSGYGVEKVPARDAIVNTVKETWKGKAYLQIKQGAYEKLLAYYAELNK